MICPLCGCEFDEDQAELACRSCPFLSKRCGSVRCPNCSYEIPKLPAFARRVVERDSDAGKRPSRRTT